jgi:hypothetical protein
MFPPGKRRPDVDRMDLDGGSSTVVDEAETIPKIVLETTCERFLALPSQESWRWTIRVLAPGEVVETKSKDVAAPSTKNAPIVLSDRQSPPASVPGASTDALKVTEGVKNADGAADVAVAGPAPAITEAPPSEAKATDPETPATSDKARASAEGSIADVFVSVKSPGDDVMAVDEADRGMTQGTAEEGAKEELDAGPGPGDDVRVLAKDVGPERMRFLPEGLAILLDGGEDESERGCLIEVKTWTFA